MSPPVLGTPGDPAPTPRFIDLLGEASSASISALARTVHARTFERGAILVRQGDATDVVLVVDGVVAARRVNDEGRRLTLFLLTAYQLSGLGSLAHDRISPVDLVALTAGRIETVPGAVLLELAAHDPELGVRLVELAVDYAVRLEHRVDEATFEGARRRLAATILEYETLIAGGQAIVSRGDLAGLIGASREMLGYALRAMEADGTVIRSGRRIEIRDRSALEHDGVRPTDDRVDDPGLALGEQPRDRSVGPRPGRAPVSSRPIERGPACRVSRVGSRNRA